MLEEDVIAGQERQISSFNLPILWQCVDFQGGWTPREQKACHSKQWRLLLGTPSSQFSPALTIRRLWWLDYLWIVYWAVAADTVYWFSPLQSCLFVWLKLHFTAKNLNPCCFCANMRTFEKNSKACKGGQSEYCCLRRQVHSSTPLWRLEGFEVWWLWIPDYLWSI